MFVTRVFPRTFVRRYATRNSTANIYDVVIVGGGPAGLSLAAALRASSVTSRLRVALIEGFPLKQWSPEPGKYQNRVSSLTPASVQFLKDSGVWNHVKRERVAAYNGMRVWDGVSGATMNFSTDLQQNRDSIAYMCENANLTSACLSRLASLPPSEGSIEILDSTRVSDIKHGVDEGDFDLSSWPVVTTSTGQTLTARLLVGADGANSPVRSFAEIETRGWDYNRFGVVATLAVEDVAAKTAYQRFLPNGPVALLPLPGPNATLVWSTTPQQAQQLKALPAEEFTAMVNAAFSLSPVDINYLLSHPSSILSEVAWRLSVSPPAPIPKVVSSVPASVAAFPLKMRHVDTYIAPRVALVGDAAHSVHPLAGQGLNQGIGDVRSLQGTIEFSVQHGQDIGSILSLEKYLEERYTDNHIMLGVVDKLHKLYGTDWAPVVAVRSLGLGLVDKLEGVKGFFMNRAAGRN